MKYEASKIACVLSSNQSGWGKKLIEGNVDGIVLDLEDGIVITRKAENREMMLGILLNADFHKKCN